MSLITIENHGPLILSSTFWDSEWEAAGKFFVSCNAGTIRILMPRSHRAAIEEMRTAREVILSRGPWPAAGLADRLESLEQHALIELAQPRLVRGGKTPE